MAMEIGENFLLYYMAREIWETAHETFSNSENTSELFHMKNELQDLKQGNSFVTTYSL